MNNKNIIFDLGGVIIDIDYNLTAGAFKRIGLTEFDNIYSKKKQDHFFDEFEKGFLSEEDFRAEVRSHIPQPVTDAEIDAAWNAMLINVPESRFNWLSDLRKTHRIFLLSNTNRIHVKAFTTIIDEQFGKGKFESLFEKTYYSCNLGMRKPDAEIFDLVVKENNLALNQTIFIDDSPQHVEGARKYGLNALHLQTGEKVNDLLSLLKN